MGGVKWSKKYSRKWCRNKSHEKKKTKSLRTTAARPILEATTNPTQESKGQDLAHLRVQISSILRLSGENLQKAIFKMTSVLQSQSRCWPQNKNSKFEKKKKKKQQFVRGPNIPSLKAGVQNRGGLGRQGGIVDAQWHEIAPKPFVLKRFVYLDFFNSTAMDWESKDEKKPRDSLEKKRRAPIPKNALSEPLPLPTKKQSFQKWNLQNANPNFAI